MDRQIFDIAAQSEHFLNRESDGLPPMIQLPRAWSGPTLAESTDWRFSISSSAADSIIRALRQVKQATALGEIELPLEDLKQEIQTWRAVVDTGPGVLLVSGIPTDKMPQASAKYFMAWLGWQFGDLGIQNPAGDIVGEIKDTNAAASDPYVRNYTTNREFRIHSDAADRVGLLCIRKARDGGSNIIASSVRVFEHLREEDNELAELLFEPAPLDLRNEQQPGEPGWGELIPCRWTGTELSTLYVSDYFRSAARHPDVEIDSKRWRLYEAYERIATSEALALKIRLEPGDLLVLNNHVTLHARTAFDDSGVDKGKESSPHTNQQGRLLLRFLASV